MSYNRSFLKHRLTVLNRSESTSDSFGRQGGQFTSSGSIWANVSWTKGKKAMSEGALDAYDYIMVRCDCHSFLKRESRIKYGSSTYQIESFHVDKGSNEVQLTAVEIQ